MRQITLDEISWQVIAEQDDTPVRGNALASGDDAEDKRVEDEILARLDDGDIWAWCSVEVRGTWNGIEASEYLGCCCYRDEDDFRQPGEYFDDMRNTVRDEIQKIAETVSSSIAN